MYCENVIVRNVTVRSHGPNTDGLNPDSCQGVLIENCFFSTGDDCIAINSGKNEDGRRVGRSCKDIIIRDCRMERGHGGVVIGSGMSGGVRNVYVHNCDFQGTDRGIRLKSIRGRGGIVENVWFENISMKNIRYEAIVANMSYADPTVTPKRDAPPTFRNIHLTNICCCDAATAVEISGLPEQPLQKITLRDIRITAIKGAIIQDVEGLITSNVSIKSSVTQGQQL